MTSAVSLPAAPPTLVVSAPVSELAGLVLPSAPSNVLTGLDTILSRACKTSSDTAGVLVLLTAAPGTSAPQMASCRKVFRLAPHHLQKSESGM